MRLEKIHIEHFVLYYTCIISVFARLLKLNFGYFAYGIVLLPFFLHVFYYIVCGASNYKFRNNNNIDTLMILLSILFLTSFLFAVLKSGLSHQLISILYIGIPLLVYFYTRKSHLTFDTYYKILAIFILIYCIYIDIEFWFYYINPQAAMAVSQYLKDIGSTNNFPPSLYFFGIGMEYKPWGPLFNASASGGFATVLAAYSIEYRKTYKSRISLWMVILSLTAIFFSGSKSAYCMCLIYLAVKAVFFAEKKLSTNAKIISSLSIFIFIILAVIFLLNFYLDTPTLKQIYFTNFVTVPLQHFMNSILNPFAFFIGYGQTYLVEDAVIIGEISFFNNITYYGFLFMCVFLVLLFYVIKLSWRKNQSICILAIMFLVAMNHYEVTLKFPCDFILFISIAVLANSTETQKHRPSHNTDKAY